MGALDAFHARVSAHPRLSTLSSSADHLTGIRGRQAAHWTALAWADPEDAYLEPACTIGLTPARIGLEPRWHLGG